MSDGLNEFELIRRFFTRAPRRPGAGVGDDCALVRPDAGMELAVSTDMLIEGRHFTSGADPRALGHKSLAVNLSDMAACGATPRWCTLAIALKEADERWLAQFSQGLFALADRYRVELVGGDTSRGPLVTINITIFGEVPAGLALTRGGARPGDDLWVSGELGGAALGLRRPEIAAAARRLAEPEPRVELGERLRGLASSAIDLSDGLAGDLGHVLQRSQAGALVQYAKLPRHPAFAGLNDPRLERDCVLSGGEDYELLFTAAQNVRPEIEALARELALPLARIGSIQAGEAKLTVLDAAGNPMPARGGFDHFAP